MLTRLRVQNFKNLRDVEVYFGPLTVIAGPNGVGKSNLLDAIRFLGYTANRPLAQAARDLRGSGSSPFDVRKLFFSVNDKPVGPMRFEADIILPPSAKDFLGQQATPSHRFLRYELDLKLSDDPLSNSPIEIVKEAVSPLSSEHLPAPFIESAAGFLSRDAAFSSHFIQTNQSGMLELWHEGLGAWTPVLANLTNNTSTLVSRIQAGASPTIAVLQDELKRWCSFQFFPDRLIEPNTLSEQATLSPNGQNLPATLFRLAKASSATVSGTKNDIDNPVYTRIVAKLRNLVPDLKTIWVNLDAASSTIYHASSLSEGTLRLIALATLKEDRQSTSLITLEEPENGIHPNSLVHLQHLLNGIVDVDPDSATQVLISTHSPGLAALCPENSLLFASASPKAFSDKSPNTLRISCLSETWREPLDSPVAKLGDLVTFLGVVPYPEWADPSNNRKPLAVYEREEFVKYRQQAAL
jgi:predicted ATPase